MSSDGGSTAERIARVREVLVAARRLVDASDPLGRELRERLPAVTGLSPEGVELGLSRHVETTASDEDLAKLVARAESAPRVHVVLSANVFVGAVRALACAVASSSSVRVRPSSREAVIAPLLVDALAGTACRDVATCGELDASRGDTVHVYGRDETIAAITREVPSGVRVTGHGPGFGIALVDARSNAESVAERLSWDVVAFDQRGCLSPRVALYRGSPVQAEAFAEALDRELAKREREVPLGALSTEERSERALYRDTASALGRCRITATSTVGLDLGPRALALPPPGRNLHVARIEDSGDMECLVAPYRRAITCVGYDIETPLASSLAAFVRGARALPIGGMQSPPLDGPVDLRGML
jgi:hypothetical protein